METTHRTGTDCLRRGPAGWSPGMRCCFAEPDGGQEPTAGTSPGRGGVRTAGHAPGAIRPDGPRRQPLPGGLALFAALRQGPGLQAAGPVGWLSACRRAGGLGAGDAASGPFPGVPSNGSWRCKLAPRAALEDLAEQARTHLGPVLSGPPVSAASGGRADVSTDLFRRASRRWPRHPPSPARRRMPSSTHRDRIPGPILGVLGIPLSAEDLDQFLAGGQSGSPWDRWSPRRSPVGSAGRCASRTNHSTPHSRRLFPRGPGVDAFDWEFNSPDDRPPADRGTGHGRFHSPLRQSGSGRTKRRGKEFSDASLGTAGLRFGLSACVTSPSAADLLQDSSARLADKSYAQRVRYWRTLRLVDHRRIRLRPAGATGFATGDQPAVQDHRRPHSAIDVSGKTNVDFDAGPSTWTIRPLAMAFLDRVVDEAHHLENPRQIVFALHRGSKARSNHAHQIPVGIGVQQADDRLQAANEPIALAKRRNATLAPLLWCITQRTCRLLLAAKLVPFLTATVIMVAFAGLIAAPALIFAIVRGVNCRDDIQRPPDPP